MVRLADLSVVEQQHLLAKCDPPLGPDVFVPAKPLSARRIALVTTAGLHLRDDARFGFVETAYRVIPGDAQAADLVMSHSSVNFDRTGFQEDINVVFPLTRFRELVGEGVIGGLGPEHFSFMGALAAPAAYETAAVHLAELLKGSGVDTVFLTPV